MRNSRRGRRLPAGERRRKLLDLGIQLLDEGELEGISTHEVARRAGISAGLLYHYFPSKRRFRDEVLAELAGRLDRARSLAAGLTTRDAVRDSLACQIDFAEAHPRGYRILVAGAGDNPRTAGRGPRLGDEQLGRLLGRGSAHVTPEARTLVHGWIGGCEAAILDWLQRRELPKARLISLLESMLGLTLAAIDAAARGSEGVAASRAKPRVRLVPRPPPPGAV